LPHERNGAKNEQAKTANEKRKSEAINNENKRMREHEMARERHEERKRTSWLPQLSSSPISGWFTPEYMGLGGIKRESAGHKGLP
jgi:hypothetical protein